MITSSSLSFTPNQPPRFGEDKVKIFIFMEQASKRVLYDYYNKTSVFNELYQSILCPNYANRQIWIHESFVYDFYNDKSDKRVATLVRSLRNEGKIYAWTDRELQELLKGIDPIKNHFTSAERESLCSNGLTKAKTSVMVKLISYAMKYELIHAANICTSPYTVVGLVNEMNEPIFGEMQKARFCTQSLNLSAI